MSSGGPGEDPHQGVGALSTEKEERPWDALGYYATLAVPRRASPREIRGAFLDLSRRYHTDKHSAQSEDVQQLMNTRFLELQEAYAVLMDERRRAAYDAAGAMGEELLALVPAGVSARADILRYLDVLEREARVKQLATILGAWTSGTARFSLVNLPLVSEEMENPPAAAVPPLTLPASLLQEITLAEVAVNGGRQMVLLPSGAALAALRQWREAQAPRPTGRRRLTPGRALRHVLAPREVSLYHGFEHRVSPATLLSVRTEALSRPATTVVSLSTSVEHTRGPTSYTGLLRVALAGAKVSLARARDLSPRWHLQTKLTCLHGDQWMQALQLTLRRTLSPHTVLENALQLSMWENGFFRTRWIRSRASTSEEVLLFLTHHSVYLTLTARLPVRFGAAPGPHAGASSPAKTPPEGSLQYSVSTHPFTGQTHVGLELWYNHVHPMRYGVGFATKLPYAMSPLSPPWFLVQSPTYAVANEVTLLYGRGNHTLRVPILVFVAPRVSRAVLWLGVPVTAFRLWRVLHRLRTRARETAFYTRERATHLVEVDVAREKALLEQRILEPGVWESRAAEERLGGLVIVNAQYGVLHPTYVAEAPPRGGTSASPHVSARAAAWVRGVVIPRVRQVAGAALSRWWHPRRGTAPGDDADARTGPTTAGHDREDQGAAAAAAVAEELPLTLDVTVAVQNLVHQSALRLPEGTKSRLVGFCDPDPYTPERKYLKITYRFHGVRHRGEWHDMDEVILPNRDHLVR